MSDSALVVLAVAGAAAIATMKASVYGDRTTLMLAISPLTYQTPG
ncbi:MAG TPA: hypothetical protein VJN72_06765 [Gaiellales bacterium]|nr:hypothetical protein [Gaiellales bacterium]